MEKNPNYSNRENFLMSLLNKVTNEYKALLEFTRKSKPFKIAEIISLSPIPGETLFLIQLTNKDCILKLSAADLISKDYNLNHFSNYHAEIIRHAAQGKLIEFLKLSDNNLCNHKIISKKFDRDIKQYIFCIETPEHEHFICTAEELAQDKNLLSHLDQLDVYDIGYTHGNEESLKEKTELLLAKST